MTTDIEPLERPPIVPLVVGAGSLVVGFFVVRWLLGAVWGLIQFGFYAAIVVAIVYVVARLWRGFNA